MALKKPDVEEKQPTAEEVEAKRVADAKAQEEQQAKDDAEAKLRQEEADKAEAARLEQEAADKKLEDEKAEKDAADKETERLALLQEEADKQAASDRERLAQEEEVAKAAGKTPRELTLVLVESNTHSDLRQPSTGTWITGKGQAHLLSDGWLNNQIASKLMKIVEE